jgi:hypothetical protein
MARTPLVTQQVAQAGGELTFEASNPDGHSLDGGGAVVLHIRNDDASPKQVTIQSAAQVAGLDVADQVVVVPAGELWHIGRFTSTVFDRPAGTVDAGTVYVDYDAVTNLFSAAEGV